MGNPLTYRGNTLTWNFGRRLASFGNISYTYNEDGIRTKKIIGNKTTEFYLDGSNIIRQSDGTDTLYFFYDRDDNLTGFEHNGDVYFYVKNMQGDIVAISDDSGNVVAEYTYDPWGKVLSVTGTNSALGNLNPFRYRGYYYDTDTNLYYLQSRYYDPETGRFLNSDDVNFIGTTESEISYNPFAYCENDPVNAIDECGYLGRYWWNSVKWVSRIIDVIIIAVSLGRTYMSYKALKQFLKVNKNRVVYQIRGKILEYFGWSIVRVLPTVIEIALTLFGTSIGEMIAKALDYIDSWWGYKRSNGYILN